MSFRIFSITLIFIFSGLVPSIITSQDILPPLIPWSGESESLVVSPGHPWVTVAEATGFVRTATYAETCAYLEKLCTSSPLLKLVYIGTSGNNLDIPMVIASSEHAFEPEQVRKSAKYTLLAQACIHAGEVDGKDAGMMLLRDIASGSRESLLEKVNFLFVPVLNPDGHERASKYNRANQRGPENMGWRTNAQNLNLNRDYTKLDTRELRAVLKAIQEYTPDLYMDIHVTDGADYQYDITYGFIGLHGYSPAISLWLKNAFRPGVDEGLRRNGHIPGPLLFAVGGGNFTRGNIDYMFSPIFSHAYGDLCHIPTILVENHSLKPYRQRVLGTYVLLEESLKALGKYGEALEHAIQEDRKIKRDSLPVSWSVPQFGGGRGPAASKDLPPPDSMLLLGVRSAEDSSVISRSGYVKWLGEPQERMIANYVSGRPVKWVPKAKTYYIPPAWHEVIDRVESHGVKVEYLDQAADLEVTMYRITNPKLSERAFEGRVKVQGEPVAEVHVTTFPEGTAVVHTDQPLGDLACYLLEPGAGESLFQWGFFNGILSRTEYMETYVLEPLMSKMLGEDTALKKAYNQKMETDSTFANSPQMIRNWFYERSPFIDSQYLLYPVGMIR